MFGRYFAPSKFKMLSYDWTGSKMNLVLVGLQVDEVDRFNYLGKFISPGGRISGEVSSHIQKNPIGF